MSRASAAAISIATKSSGLSSRRAAALVLRTQPIGTDDDQNDIARSHLAVQMRYEVDPGRNVVDIHKEFVAAERLREPIVQPTGHADRIFSAVIDENLAGHGLPGLPERPQILPQDRSNHYELAYTGPVRLLAQLSVDLTRIASHARFGSKADIRAAKNHVRFTPESVRNSGHRLPDGRACVQ